MQGSSPCILTQSGNSPSSAQTSVVSADPLESRIRSSDTAPATRPTATASQVVRA